MKTYVSNMATTKERPHDAFSHAHSLIETPDVAVSDFSQLCEKQVLLANIGSDQHIRYYQNDIINLTRMFDWACRDAGLTNFFRCMYYGWIGELQITRTKGGMESQAQHNVAAAFNRGPPMSSYGSEPQQQQQQPEQNLLDKILKRGQRQPQQ